jgi:hypothetical protein
VRVSTSDELVVEVVLYIPVVSKARRAERRRKKGEYDDVEGKDLATIRSLFVFLALLRSFSDMWD